MASFLLVKCQKITASNSAICKSTPAIEQSCSFIFPQNFRENNSKADLTSELVNVTFSVDYKKDLVSHEIEARVQ